MFGPLGDRRYKEYSADILASGQHLLALINDILDMSKIEAGKMSLHLETVDVAEMAAEAVRLMRNRAESAGLLIAVAAPRRPAHDRGRLSRPQADPAEPALQRHQVHPPGRPHHRARRGRCRPPKAPELRISVADTGIGIAPEDLGRLARPFEQIETQHSKTQQGTGLGLALTKALVELHEGVLGIESEPGVGTTVSFTLPLRPAAPAKVRVEMEPMVMLA